MRSLQNLSSWPVRLSESIFTFRRFVRDCELICVRVCRSTSWWVISARYLRYLWCTVVMARVHRTARVSKTPARVAGYIRTRACYIVPQHTTYAVTFVSPAIQPPPLGSQPPLHCPSLFHSYPIPAFFRPASFSPSLSLSEFNGGKFSQPKSISRPLRFYGAPFSLPA